MEQHNFGNPTINDAQWRADVEARMKKLKLSRRKREIAWLVLAGMDNREIAETLFISIPTVKNHLWDVCNDLDIVTAPHTPRRLHFAMTLLGIDMHSLRSQLVQEFQPNP